MRRWVPGAPYRRNLIEQKEAEGTKEACLVWLSWSGHFGRLHSSLCGLRFLLFNVFA